MEQAHILRPNGPIIKKKLEEYRQMLTSNNFTSLQKRAENKSKIPL